jgi:carbon-monoxide dehydrogenase medium subunit
MSHFEYYKPQSLNEIWELREKIPGARYIAGGTDIMVRVRKGILAPEALISLRAVPELKNISSGEDIRIGAATTMTELIEHPQLESVLPVLVQAAKTIGSVQIRNVGTIGGNLCNCSPCADTAPALLVLEARAVVCSVQHTREIPLHNFFVGPGESCLAPQEILVELRMDKPNSTVKAIAMKKGRVQLDLALASVAVLLELEGNHCKKARLAAGSVATVPLRLREVEKVLENAEITEEKVREAQKVAMESVSPISDVRSTADYRRHLVGVYVKHGIQKLVDGARHDKRN